MPPRVPAQAGEILLDQLLGHRRLQRIVNGGRGLTGDGKQRLGIEGPAQRRRGLEHGGALVAEALDAKQDRLSDGLGQHGAPDRDAIRSIAGPRALHHLAQHLLEDEGVAFRPLQHQLVQLGVDVVWAENRREHLPDAVLGERSQLHQIGHVGAPPALQRRQERVAAMELVRPVGDNDQ